MFHVKHTKKMTQYTIKIMLVNGEMTYFVSGKKFKNYADAKQYCIDNAEMWHKTASITICGCNE